MDTFLGHRDHVNMLSMHVYNLRKLTGFWAFSFRQTRQWSLQWPTKFHYYGYLYTSITKSENAKLRGNNAVTPAVTSLKHHNTTPPFWQREVISPLSSGRYKMSEFVCDHWPFSDKSVQQTLCCFLHRKQDPEQFSPLFAFVKMHN